MITHTVVVVDREKFLDWMFGGREDPEGAIFDRMMFEEICEEGVPIQLYPANPLEKVRCLPLEVIKNRDELPDHLLSYDGILDVWFEECLFVLE